MLEKVVVKLIKYISKFIVFGTLWTCLSAGAVYKWVDEQGNVHFGNIPPPKAKVEQTSISTHQAQTNELDDVISGTWDAVDGSRKVRFQVWSTEQSGWSYLWSETVNGSTSGSSSGYLQEEGMNLKMLDKKGALIRQFTVKEVQQNKLVLIDQASEVFYNLRKPQEERYDLKEKEKQILGEWAEVNPGNSDQPIRFISFEYGQFGRYKASRFDSIRSRPNPNFEIAKGDWRVEDDVLVLDYISATESLSEKAGKTEEWKINKLEYRELHLKIVGGQEQLYFRRERE